MPTGSSRADPFSGLGTGKPALFLDFDGTLAPIVDRPDAVRIDPEIVDVLARLDRLFDGALAVLSGRPIEQLDALLAPLLLPAAGVHGLQRRDAGGQRHDSPVDPDRLSEAAARITAFAAGHPGLIVELKPASVALHYRLRPDLQAIARAEGERAAASLGLALLNGKCVVELKAGDATKGDALAAFMLERPFAGRTPVMAGDDVTDEAAFAVAQRLGGIAIKIGGGETAAKHRMASPEELHAWLKRLVTDLPQPEPA